MSSETATTSNKKYVSLQTAAAVFELNPRTLRRAIAAGQITGYRFGPRVLRLDLDEVEAAFRVIPTAGDAA